ncbi:hypothetical protein [Neolewinella agarilytica]|uniref:Uncharacterized protein n=1 Tax=Neolewinella agarilytica TaxID=478744 RepID=A0A1H9IIK5_9BACT|nr:hypothetical protein [Neolewinella agarilytica]SEQ74541.1 hypothetical protein SAMN05444359_11520 [Neolewinella agarilytica]
MKIKSERITLISLLIYLVVDTIHFTMFRYGFNGTMNYISEASYESYGITLFKWIIILASSLILWKGDVGQKTLFTTYYPIIIFYLFFAKGKWSIILSGNPLFIINWLEIIGIITFTKLLFGWGQPDQPLKSDIITGTFIGLILCFIASKIPAVQIIN